MKTLSIKDNDIFLDVSGNLSISEGKEAMAMIATNKARTLYKETPLNQTAGIPFFDVVFNRFDIELFKQYLFEELLKIDGVQEVSDFSYSTTNNTLTYEVILSTNLGEVTTNG